MFGGHIRIASILIAPYDPPTLPGGRIATYLELGILPGEFPIANDTPSGFLSKTIPAGDYVVKGLCRLKRRSCYNQGSVAFHAEPGQVIYLGQLEADAYLKRIAQQADDDLTTRAHTHATSLGLLTLSSGNDAQDRTNHGWSDPTPAGTAEAEAFMRTTYGSGTPVQAARFISTVTWQTQPQRDHIDSCGSTSAFVKKSTFRLCRPRRLGSSWRTTTPTRQPADLPGVTLSAQPDGTRLSRIDEQTTLTNGVCRLVPAGAFLQDARRSGETHVVFTTSQTEDDTPRHLRRSMSTPHTPRRRPITYIREARRMRRAAA